MLITCIWRCDVFICSNYSTNYLTGMPAQVLSPAAGCNFTLEVLILPEVLWDFGLWRCQRFSRQHTMRQGSHGLPRVAVPITDLSVLLPSQGLFTSRGTDSAGSAMTEKDRHLKACGFRFLPLGIYGSPKQTAIGSVVQTNSLN